MKKLYILPLLLLAFTANAQLIQNGDFETLSDCPDVFDFNTSIQSSMMHWLAVQGTADGYHNACNAIATANTPNIPDVATGEGFAGLWGPYEAFGCLLTEAIDPTRQFCLTFDLLLTEVDSQEPVEATCTSICVYGSNTEPEEPDAFDIPVPIDEMDDMHFLGCSDPQTDTEDWAERSISFTPDDIYEYMIFVTGQDAACFNEGNYLVLDNVVLEECTVINIEESAQEAVLVYPNPSSGLVNLRLPSNAFEVVVTNLQGQIVDQFRVSEGQQLTQLRLATQGSYFIQITNRQNEILMWRQVHITE